MLALFKKKTVWQKKSDIAPAAMSSLAATQADGYYVPPDYYDSGAYKKQTKNQFNKSKGHNQFLTNVSSRNCLVAQKNMNNKNNQMRLQEKNHNCTLNSYALIVLY